MAFLGDDDDLFAAIAAGAVFPHHRLEHQHHSRLEDEVVVELVAEIGSDHWGFGGVHTDAVAKVEVRQPRPGAAVGFRCRPAQFACGGAGAGDVEDRVHDLPPLAELGLLTRCRALADHPGTAEVGAIALIGDADVGPQHVACHQFALSCQQRQRQITVSGPDAVGFAFGHHLPDRLQHAGHRAEFECAAHEPGRQVDLPDARCQCGLHVDHGGIGDPHRGTHARQFVRGLDQLGSADDLRGVGRPAGPEQPRLRAPHGPGELVDRDDGRCRD